MSDAKFLGLCIVFAAVLISGTIVWSTEIKLAAVTPVTKDVPISAAAGITTVHLDGPVSLAPFPAPIPVTLQNTDDAPVIVKQKDSPGNTWHRNP